MQCQNRKYAPFFTRATAYIIDMIVVGMVSGFVTGIPDMIAMFWSDFPLTQKIWFDYSIVDILAYMIGVLYFTFATARFGQTLGKKLMNIKVVSVTGEALTFGNVFYREFIGRLLHTGYLGFLYIIAAVTKNRQGIHDMLSDTMVVYDFEVEEKKASVQEFVPTPPVLKPNESIFDFPVMNEQPQAEDIFTTHDTDINVQQSLDMIRQVKPVNVMQQEEQFVQQPIDTMVSQTDTIIPQPIENRVEDNNYYF